jgi:cytochrome oxidase Cu insertion factor (SCO1/SenC/PrrC family)
MLVLILGLSSRTYLPAAPIQKPKQVEEFADRYEKMFAPRDPKVGSTVADVSAFDEDGNEFALKQTRGKHTVLVFGCLT